ncbi:putative Glutathione S-transferase [Hypsibius exemplaris]|uniref:glutathione transferase n=1 Tax=Hypsibius exemplaris TaxID=2072580 RepID=A0A1W0WEC0_HYPEX|nr:putative Glutathione S-transferase [Hypsibius exemplaris]
MFAYAGVPFEDYRINELPAHRAANPADRPEWNAIKSKLPFGVVPVLEVDGEYLGDTCAIARYLAQPLGLSGANDWEEAEADAIVTFILSSDFDFPFMEMIAEMEPERRKDAMERLKMRIPKVAETLEKLLEKNNSSPESKGFFIGSTPTIADFFSVNFIDVVETYIQPGLLNDFAVLQAHARRIRDLPGIKEFIETHADLADFGKIIS